MWIWIGMGGVAAYLVARSQQKSWEWEGQSRQAEYCGKPVPHIVRETKLKGQILLRVGVRMPPGVEFRIAREGMLSGFLRRAKIGREIESGLPNFDHQFEVQSEDARIASWLRDSAPARAIITRLFGKSVSTLVAHGDRLWVDMTIQASDNLQAYTVTQTAAALLELRATAPPTRGAAELKDASVWSRAWLPMMWTYGWAATALVTYLGSAFFQYPQTLDSFSWRMSVSAWALAISPLCIWLAARWLRDSIMARIVLAEFITIGTIGFAFGAGLVAERGNIEMAWAPIQTAQVEVRSSSSERHRRSTSYYLYLAPFVPGATASAKLKVSSGLYRALLDNSSQQIELRWRSGTFGQPIVVDEPKFLAAPAAK